MGVLSRQRNIKDVASEVGGDDRVAVLSCNNCVRACGCGGEVHLDRICGELGESGVRVEETILIPNPCARGYLENYPLGDAVSAAVILACPGCAAGFKTLHPDIRVVAGIESLGLFVNSKSKGRLKLAAVFPGYESLKDKEFKLGDTSVMFDDEQMKIQHTEETAS